jgi:hypothetical protein
MSQERFRCEGCGGIGDGMSVGEDAITGMQLCPKCQEEFTLKRVLGDDWGKKTSMRTDPNINDPLPEPTLEEAIGEEGAKKYKESQGEKSEVDARLDRMEANIAKIIAMFEEKK